MSSSCPRIGNSWTEREIATVRSLYQQIGAKNLAIRLGRTSSAITTKAKELNITVPRKKREQACATG